MTPVRRITLAAVVLLLAACDAPSFPVGEFNEIVVAAPARIRETLAPQLAAALEPRFFTVRDEKIFDVGYVLPADLAASRMLRMRQVLLIGSADVPLIAEALDGRDAGAYDPPVVLQVPEVWAEDQVVTIALLPEAADPALLGPLLPQIGEYYRRRFEEHVRVRYALTPANEILAEQLRRTAGFTIDVPRTYRLDQPEPGMEPGIFVFSSEEAGPTPVSRSITVASRARDAVAWTPEAAAAWRAELVRRRTRPPHLTELVPRSIEGRLAGRPVIRIQGIWTNPPGAWPAAGPFISRLIDCGDRVFLADAWLYAPAEPKYEPMFRLDRILDTFRCPGDA